MVTSKVVWVIDTCSITEVRRSLKSRRPRIFKEMTQLVSAGRLVYPPQVVAELARYVQPKSPDPQFTWAKGNASAAHSIGNCSLDEVKEVLIEVPDVLDPDKDAGEDEADPYVLAVARKLRDDGIDARVITEERRDTNRKAAFLRAEKIIS